MIWIPLAVNPEPWRIGSVTTRQNGSGKSYGKVAPDSQLVAYQEAVREAAGEWLSRNGFTAQQMLAMDLNKITFYYWRQLAQYQGPTRRVTKQHVDVTNLNKGTEDALQGIFYRNDVTNIDVRGAIIEQSVLVERGMVLICLEETTSVDIVNSLPPHVFDLVNREWKRFTPPPLALVENKVDKPFNPSEYF